MSAGEPEVPSQVYIKQLHLNFKPYVLFQKMLNQSMSFNPSRLLIHNYLYVSRTYNLNHHSESSNLSFGLWASIVRGIEWSISKIVS